MALTKRRLKGLIEYSDSRNELGTYTEDDVVGVSTDKCIISTKANLDGVDLRKYKLFPPEHFAFVADTSRRGDRIALAYNDTDRTYIVSTWYVVFSVRDDAKDVIASDYLFLYFNRPEFDRYARINSWGSAREYFWFADMEDIIMDIPSLPVQQKYISIYNTMLANQQNYARGLDDLKLAFDVLLDIQKDSSPTKPLGQIFQEINTQNVDGAVSNVQGINIDKQFMPSVANMTDVDLKKYKVVKKGQFAYSGMQTGRDECIRIALYTGDDPVIISPAYSVMQVIDDEILPEYIMMWFLRKESDRRGWFMSDASIRTNLDLPRFYEIEIPVPPLPEQKAIVEIYDTYITRREINNVLKARLKDICPVLIKGSLEEEK